MTGRAVGVLTATSGHMSNTLNSAAALSVGHNQFSLYSLYSSVNHHTCRLPSTKMSLCDMTVLVYPKWSHHTHAWQMTCINQLYCGIIKQAEHTKQHSAHLRYVKFSFASQYILACLSKAEEKQNNLTCQLEEVHLSKRHSQC